jgi:hypothetical protein
MANLQIKGIDDTLYAQIKALAASENRSVSQQILYLVKRHMANQKQLEPTPAQALLALTGSWEDSREADEIVSTIRNARQNSSRFEDDADVFT